MKEILILTILLLGAHAMAKPAPQDEASVQIMPNEQLEQNKKVVLDFYQEVFGDKNVDAADKYIDSTSYIQHDPLVGDGLEALKMGMKEWFKDAPQEKIDVQRISAEDDLVWLHTKLMNANNSNRTTSIVDIFKLKDGKIIEHWDVAQDVPENSVNSHPMF